MDVHTRGIAPAITVHSAARRRRRREYDFNACLTPAGARDAPRRWLDGVFALHSSVGAHRSQNANTVIARWICAFSHYGNPSRIQLAAK